MIIGISGKIGSGKDTVGNIIHYLFAKEARKLGTTKTSPYKDWVDYVETHNGWETRKFADKLKDMVCLLINCTREQLEDRDFKEAELGKEWWVYGAYQHGFNLDELVSIHNKKEDAEHILKFSHMNRVELIKLTPRLILQLLGTEAGRQIIHPNIWCNSLFSEYYGDSDIKKGRKWKHVGKECKTVKPILPTSPNWIITDMRFPNELEAVKSRGGISIRVERWVFDPNNPERQKSTHPSETALDNAEFDYVIDNNGTFEELVEKVEIILKEKELL